MQHTNNSDTFPLFWDPSETALDKFRELRKNAANEVQEMSAIRKSFGKGTDKEYAKHIKELHKEALGMEKATNFVIRHYEGPRPKDTTVPVELKQIIESVVSAGYLADAC